MDKVHYLHERWAHRSSIVAHVGIYALCINAPSFHRVIEHSLGIEPLHMLSQVPMQHKLLALGGGF